MEDRESSERQRRLAETHAALERVHPENHPSDEDIAEFHELHARHEREGGREEHAAAAEERAQRARARRRGKEPPAP